MVPATPVTTRSRIRSAANPAKGALRGASPSLTPFARLAIARGNTRGRVGAIAVPLPFSPVACALTLAVTLAVAYVALIATVMSYATMTVGFSQSLRDDEAQIASLESRYLADVSSVTATNYAAEGYTKPVAELYVPKAPETALR
jgi:hypothetical protein